MTTGDARAARRAERELALSYAPREARAALVALVELDETLGAILRTTRQPLVGQMRLAWWRDALLALDQRPPPAEPVLRAVAAQLLTRDVTGAGLAGMVEGWEALLAEPIGQDEVNLFAVARGGGLFRAAKVVLGARDPMIGEAGEGWALADFSANVADPEISRRAAALAAERLDLVFEQRWSRAARPLGALALLARADLRGTPAGSPRRISRLLHHRLTGR